MRFGRSMIAGAALLGVAAAQAETGPAARIGAYDDAVVAIMKAGLPTRTRADRFQALVTAHYDMPGIAALVIGPAWSGASAADRASLVQALTRHSAVQLAKNFDSFSGERFLVDPAVQTRGDSSLVKVTIQSLGGKRDILYYRVRGGRIVDVISGGVSQLAVQRADLAGTAAAGGLPAVARKLGEVDAKALGGR